MTWRKKIFIVVCGWLSSVIQYIIFLCARWRSGNIFFGVKRFTLMMRCTGSASPSIKYFLPSGFFLISSFVKMKFLYQTQGRYIEKVWYFLFISTFPKWKKNKICAVLKLICRAGRIHWHRWLRRSHFENHLVIIFFVVLLFFLTLKKTFQVRAIKFNLVFSTFASIFLENTTAVWLWCMKDILHFQLQKISKVRYALTVYKELFFFLRNYILCTYLKTFIKYSYEHYWVYASLLWSAI